MYNNYGVPNQPMDRYNAQPIPLQAGFVPNVQVSFNCSQSMQPHIGMLLYWAIFAVQGEANNNPLRMLFFNRMAQNGYSNPESADFMEALSSACEIAMVVSSNQPPEKTISDFAQMLTQYRVSKQLYDFPSLQSSFDQQTAQAAQKVLSEFTQLMNNLQAQKDQMFNRSNQMPIGGYQSNQMAGRYPMNQQGGYQGGMSQNLHMPSNRNNFNHQINPLLDRVYGNTNQPPINKSTGWRGTPIVNKPQEPSLVQNAKSSSSLIEVNITGNVSTNPLEVVSSSSRGYSQMTSLNTGGFLANTQQTPVNQTTEFTAHIHETQYVQGLAYDPNLYQPLNPVNHSTLQIVKAPTMDRTAHLGRPHHAPIWIKTSMAKEFEEKINKAKSAEPVDKVVEVIDITKGNLQIALNENEIWDTVDIYAKTSDSEKIVVAQAAAEIVKMMPVSNDCRAFIEDISGFGDLIQLGKSIKDALLVFKERDLEAIGEINTRLTKRMNRLVNNEVGLSSGDIDNFSGDIEDQLKYILRVYGQGILDTIYKNAKKVIVEALSNSTSDSEAHAVLIDSYFEDKLTEEQSGKIIFFISPILLGSLNINSVELRLDGLNDKYSVMLKESNAPHAYEIIKTFASLPAANGMHSIKLRTSDGVMFDIAQGAFNQEALMISLC